MNGQDAWDQMLTSALRSRPEHVPAVDIAKTAIARAGAASAWLARLDQLARWTRIASAAAMLLVALIIAGGYLYWRSWAASTASDTATSAASSLDPAMMGLAAFLAAVILLTLMMVMAPERPAFRLSPI